MASPFQQQVRQRKFLYTGLIVVLFTVSLAWRSQIINPLAERLAVRELARGEVELTGAVVRLGLTGSRGLATCILWSTAIDKQKRNQWSELEVLVRSLTKLQPYFITPWLFQSWNLAYNVSVESDRVRDKYFYVSRGIELLAEGERQNRNHPDLRWSIGFYLQHKICQSDETNFQRSLFQLSLIPPNRRDPARFWKQDENGAALFNWAEFETFCKEHPQLARRLKDGMHRDSSREKKRQFTCERPEEVVQFLEENFQVPSLYKVDPLPSGVPAYARVWNPAKQDVLLETNVRFPVLPPPHDRPFDRTALTSESSMSDHHDAYSVSHAWFCYAQEPLPDPSKTLPGHSEDIVNRALHRRPKNMTTLIFRNYPAQACRYMAERMQQEGWFDDDAWDAKSWFLDAKQIGRAYSFGGGTKWSLDAWKRAFSAWQSHGEQNLLLYRNQAEEQDIRERGLRFAKRYKMEPNGAPPPLREETLSPEEKAEFEAAKFLFELDFYRRVSNFMHHYNRTMVEQREETVACRKLFFLAEQEEMVGSPTEALKKYREPITVSGVEAWRDKKLSPLDAWKQLVLLRNKDFRRDSFIQEQTAEYELRYMRVYNRYPGRTLKTDLMKAGIVLPMLPKFHPDDFRAPIVLGPFEENDDEGRPLVEEQYRDLILERMGFGTRRRMPTPPPGVTGPEVPQPARRPTPVSP